MACNKCGHKGYLEDSIAKDNTIHKSVRPCHHCNDTKAYYRYIKEKYGSNKTTKENIEEGSNVVSLSDRRKGK